MIFALVDAAVAELPPPDYRDALMGAAADEVARRARAEGLDAAADFAERWSRQVGDDTRLAYELGLASRLAGEPRAALRRLDRAVELDPGFAPARYDRGEILLSVGELDRAEADFREVARLAPDQWAGHFRLADIAGLRADAAAFERHLLDALRHGFSFRDIVGDPRWSRYVADPMLGPVVRRLVVVYQGEEVLEALLRGG